MKKKLLTIAMAVCLLITMMPVYTGVVFAAEYEADDIKILGKSCAPTTIGGTNYFQTTDSEIVEGTSGKYNISIKNAGDHKYEIALNDAIISTSGAITGIELKGTANNGDGTVSPSQIGYKITLEGTNTIATSGAGIFLSDNYTLHSISGPGSLTITSSGNGIEMNGGPQVTIENGAKITTISSGKGIVTSELNIHGAETEVTATGDICGIEASRGINITNGARVKATGIGADGIYVGYGNLNISGKNTKVTATGVTSGIFQKQGEAANITGGAVVEASGSGTTVENAMDPNTKPDGGIVLNASTITIEGSSTTVTATGAAYGLKGRGDSGAMTVTGGAIVNATGSSQRGIGAYDIYIRGAETNVIAKGEGAIAGNSVTVTDGAKVDATATATPSDKVNDKYLSAIGTSLRIAIQGNGTDVSTTGGKYGLYTSAVPSEIIMSDGAKLMVQGTPNYGIMAEWGSITVTSGAIVKAVGTTQAMFGVLAIDSNLSALAATEINGTPAETELSELTTSLTTFKVVNIEPKKTPTTPSSPSTPSSQPSAPTITITDGTTDNIGGSAAFDKPTGVLTITPDSGFAIKEVLVNGQSKGAVTSLEGISVYDSVKVVFEKIPEKTPEEIQAEKDAKISAGVKATTITISAKASSKGIKLTWKKSKGYKVDKYLVYRSVSGGKYKLYKITKSTSFTNSKVAKGKVYRFKVKGVRTVGEEKAYTQTSTIIKVRAK